MKGIMKNSLPGGAELSPLRALAAAADLGLDGVLFNAMHDLSPSLDPAEMRLVRAEADRLGLYISAGLGVVNPALPFRGARTVEAGAGDLEAGFRRLISLAADIGVHDPFFVIGMIEERFQVTPSWQTQRDALAAMILRCAPLLRQRGSRLLLKTHEEITTSEIVALVERVGSDLLGVAYDPVNVLCRLEDPVVAVQRIAPHVAQIHVDDAILRFEENGIRRYLAPLGEGCLDWATILALLPNSRLWIEMHKGQFAMPVFEADWLRRQPEIALNEFAAVLAAANRFGSGEVPWDQGSPTDRLPAAIRRPFS